jgi:uroporphyrinogen III methyltransferase/synthase
MTSPANLPLADKSVLVACSARKSDALVVGLTALGAQVLAAEVIKIREIADRSAINSALSQLESYDWLVFASSYAVLFFAKYLNERGAVPTLPRVCAVGPATAATARECGFDVALVPEDFVAEGILRALALRQGGIQGLAGLRILLPRAREARDVLSRDLTAAGAHVDVVSCYENVPGEIDEKALRLMRERRIDLLVFTSSSTVKSFLTLAGEEFGRTILERAAVAALGPVTARTIESFGKKCDIVPAENTIPSLIEAIHNYYAAAV